jgi:PPOX class probable F420-dependent enzyme
MMDLDKAIELARSNHHTILATRRADGRPQISPVVSAVDDGGRVLISTREAAAKVLNLRRDPQASVCVLADNFFGDWAQLDGTTEIVALPEAMDLLEFIYRQVSGEHPDWEEFRQAMVQQRRVVLRITPTAAGPTYSG